MVLEKILKPLYRKYLLEVLSDSREKVIACGTISIVTPRPDKYKPSMYLYMALV
jgi:hypothetical protein